MVSRLSDSNQIGIKMLSFEKKSKKLYLVASVVAIGLSLSSVVYAQSADAQVELEDFSVDLDALPPQPVQTTLPEEEVVTPVIPVTEVSSPSPQQLNPVQETTAPVDVVNDSVVTTPQPVPHSGQYYDANSIVPSSQMRSAIGPREVDPKYEPGSSYVVVRRGAGADSIAAQLVSAQRALKLERYSSALEMYEQLYKRSPKNHQVLMGLAVAQQKNGFVESALATYEELLAHEPKNTDAMVNMMGLLKQTYPSVAYRKLVELWEKDPQNPGVAAQLGLTSAEIGNAQEAIRYLGIAATLEPNNPLHYYNMAVITDRAGASKDAIDLYQKALEVDVAYGAGRSVPREQIYDRLAQLRRL